MTDNTTAVAYVRNMGGSHSLPCNDITRQIWEWCVPRNIWLSISYIPGEINVIADQASRVFGDSAEWKLYVDVFNRIANILGTTTIDMFASRLNYQLTHYVSWLPDPQAMAIVPSLWIGLIMSHTPFPPLASYHNFFQKLEMDQAQAILIAPNWPTQPWYPQANKTLDSDATPPARTPSTIQPRTAPPPGGTASFDGLPLIRKSLQGIGISQATQDTILNSWRTATRKQYWVYLEKWQSFSPICKRCVGVSARTLSKGFRVQLSQHCKKCPIHLHSP